MICSQVAFFPFLAADFKSTLFGCRTSIDLSSVQAFGPCSYNPHLWLYNSSTRVHGSPHLPAFPILPPSSFCPPPSSMVTLPVPVSGRRLHFMLQCVEYSTDTQLASGYYWLVETSTKCKSQFTHPFRIPGVVSANNTLVALAHLC
jgi:hypothetical protein